MPISFDEIAEIPEVRPQPRADSQRTQTGDKLTQLWVSNHPEGGGPCGGRDNALTQLLGHLRGKRLPYELALDTALMWNQSRCDPPLDEYDVREKVERTWQRWPEGTLHDSSGQMPGQTPPRVLLTSNDLLDLADEVGGQQWIVPNVFVRAGLHFLSSPPACGKSWVMLELARCMVNGAPWLGYPVEKGAVLYIDGEMGEHKMAPRIRQLDFGRDLPFFYIGKPAINLNDFESRAYVLDQIKANHIVLVLVDTLTSTVPGLRENDVEFVSRLRPIFNEMTEAGAAVIVAHHDRKGGQGEDKAAHARMAGSRDLAAMCEMAYGLEKAHGRYHLSITKNRHLSDDEAASIDFAIESAAAGKVSLRVLDPDELSEARCNALDRRIVEYLDGKGPSNVTTICEGVGGNRAAVIAALRRLENEGAVTWQKQANAKVYRAAGDE